MDYFCTCPALRPAVPLFDDLLAISGQWVIVGGWCPDCEWAVIFDEDDRIEPPTH